MSPLSSCSLFKRPLQWSQPPLHPHSYFLSIPRSVPSTLTSVVTTLSRTWNPPQVLTWVIPFLCPFPVRPHSLCRTCSHNLLHVTSSTRTHHGQASLLHDSTELSVGPSKHAGRLLAHWCKLLLSVPSSRREGCITLLA